MSLRRITHVVLWYWFALAIAYAAQPCHAQIPEDDSSEPESVLWEPPEIIEAEPENPGWTLAGNPLPQFVRGLNATTTLIADGESHGLDQYELGTSVSFIIPDLLFESDSFLSLTPSFSAMTLEGPADFDLPNVLYRTGTTISWMTRPGDTWTYAVGITPGVASDFRTSQNAIRIIGHTMATYQWRPDVQLMFGAAYLDRDDIPALPVAGAIWTPSDDLRVELAFPRPRIVRRIAKVTAGGITTEHWFYLAGELGGGTWAVERSPGFADELTLRDFRLVFGYESKSDRRINIRSELGFVFGRKVEYESDSDGFEPGEALMMRAGLSF